MKKLLVIVLALAMLLVVVACEDPNVNSSSDSSLNEGTTVSSENTTVSNSVSNENTTSSNSASSESIASSSSSTSSSSSSSSSTANLSEIEKKANNVLTWQIPDNGGWDKDFATHTSKARTSGSYITKGWTANGKPLGTIDNDGTYSEMRVLAEAYTETGAQKYKDGWDKAVKFLENLQYDNGGFAQVYPRRGNYSDCITINDNAMVNVLRVLKEVADNKAPFKTIVTSSERAKFKTMFDKGIECLINLQLTVKGEKSGWCAQYDPKTLAPAQARAYEHPSVSGSESIGVIQLLMEQTSNTRAIQAGKSAIKWFDKVKLVDTGFNNKSTLKDSQGKIMYFYPQAGKNTWYRFYDINTCEPIFSDMTGKIFRDISLISQERREGYSWAGNWPQKVIDKYGVN